MTAQRRGHDTKEKILEVACKVFAEKGYRDATLAEICHQAGANIASVNYYFTSKQALYQDVFEHLSQKAERLYPLSGGLPENAAPEERLCAFIHAFLSRLFDPERLGYLHQIHMAERFNPTGLLEEALGRWLAYNRGITLNVVRAFFGPEPAQRDLEWCEMCVIGQCLVGTHKSRKCEPRALFNIQNSDLEDLTEYIYRFSLAGIRAVATAHRQSSP